MKPWFRALAVSTMGMLAAAGAAGDTPVPDAAKAPVAWRDVPTFAMQGGLQAFWNVGTGAGRAQDAAARTRGFAPITLLNAYADYPGRQKENVYDALTRPPNPWRRPAFFERTVRRNIDRLPPAGPYVLDIEIPIAPAPAAWSNREIRADSGAASQAAFTDAYARAWTDWYALPARWAKARYPGTPVGFYGLPPFWYEDAGFVGASRQQLERKHALDLKIWEAIDPHVDFYAVSIYAFRDRPDTVMMFAANVEENYRRTRAFGEKPVYAYAWLRHHDQNKALGNREVAPYLAEAMAIVPYFSGARGVVLWGWEPTLGRGDVAPYRTLPLFAQSLARVAALSDRIGRGRLEMETSAHELWNARKPLVRKVVFGPDACVVMAVDPWQAHDARALAPVTCGRRTVAAPLRGKHTTLMLVENGQVAEY